MPSMPEPGLAPGQRPANGEGDPSLASIRDILLTPERERLRQLEQERERLQVEVEALQAALDRLEEEAQLGRGRLYALLKELIRIEKRLEADTAALADNIDQVIADKVEDEPERMAEVIGPVMAGALRVQERRSREELIDSVGPILGEAIQVQLQESRQSLIDALYPIIGDTALRYIREFFREFQRNIDARLRATFGAEGFLRQWSARLRGVNPADLIVRDALPYSVRELFLIQSGSGLLLAHAGSEVAGDSDLIGGMLTAIRDFAHDSFGDSSSPDALDEIQYGEQRIIVQDGHLAYLAAVITGIEPSGFRAHLRRYVARLHADHADLLQAYDGSLESLGRIPVELEQLSKELASLRDAPQQPLTISRAQKWGFAVGVVLLLLFGCFYLKFTLALLPVAFPSLAGTPAATPSTTAPTATPTPAPTQTPPVAPPARITPGPSGAKMRPEWLEHGRILCAADFVAPGRNQRYAVGLSNYPVARFRQ